MLNSIEWDSSFRSHTVQGWPLVSFALLGGFKFSIELSEFAFNKKARSIVDALDFPIPENVVVEPG